MSTARNFTTPAVTEQVVVVADVEVTTNPEVVGAVGGQVLLMGPRSAPPW